MSPPWEDVIVRARGLGGRLLGRQRLEQLAGAPDLAALVRELSAELPELQPTPEAEPVAIDVAVRRAAARELWLLARWCGTRAPYLAPLFEDEDRRSIRAIVRGTVAGAPAEMRITGLVPTPALPEAALRELARQSTALGVSTLLTTWGNSYGPALLPEAQRRRPDLFLLELAVDRHYFERARRVAKRDGRPLKEHVAAMIDLENAWTALLVSSQTLEHDPKTLFIPGGRALRQRRFLAAVKAGSESAAADVLREALAGSFLADAVSLEARATRAPEDIALQAELRELTGRVRRAPLTLATVLAFVLRLRAQSRDLCRIAWGIALGEPRALLVERLVTV